VSDLDVWLAVALLLLSTLITRSVVFLWADRLRLPPLAQHALRYAPAAAMAAIVLPDLVLSPAGLPDLSWHNPKFLAGLGATLFFLATRHMLGTIAAGMALFTVLRVVFS
jgi:branched-subunit amino acid transport protein